MERSKVAAHYTWDGQSAGEFPRYVQEAIDRGEIIFTMSNELLLTDPAGSNKRKISPGGVVVKWDDNSLSAMKMSEFLDMADTEKGNESNGEIVRY